MSHPRRGGKVMLFKFLWRNLKGYRFLFVLTILIAVSQVGCDLVSALPLKFIPSKISGDHSADPACDFPFLDSTLDLFDIWFPDYSPDKPGKVIRVKEEPCKSSTLKETDHGVTSVIVFSVFMLIIFGALGALLTYL